MVLFASVAAGVSLIALLESTQVPEVVTRLNQTFEVIAPEV